MTLRKKIAEVGDLLEKRGIRVFLPNMAEKNDYTVLSDTEATKHKSRMISEHLDKIKQSDAVLVVNETLKGVPGYIGANTFLEMGFAYALGKKIYVFNPLPEQPNKVELQGLLPVILNGDLSVMHGQGQEA